MKLLITALLAMLTMTAYSQRMKKETTAANSGYLITLDSERIDCYGSVSLTAEYVRFTDKAGAFQMTKQKKLKSMLINGRAFINLPITAGKDRMHEVIAYNDKYILTAYWHNSSYLYIFDRDLVPVKAKMLVRPGRRGQESLLDKTVVKYFGDCPALIKRMEKNIANKTPMIENISLFQCGTNNLVLQ